MCESPFFNANIAMIRPTNMKNARMPSSAPIKQANKSNIIRNTAI